MCTGFCHCAPQRSHVCTVEWNWGLGSVLLPGGGFCPFGHEGSCQLFSIRVSTAVTWQLSLRLSLESIRGLLGKYKKNMSYLIGGLPAMPLFPLTILYKISKCTQTFPHNWTTNADGGFPSRVYSFFGAPTTPLKPVV
jgi:hypothetical protein